MYINDFHYSMEEIFKSEIEGNFPYQWDEDHITRQILRSFRKNFRRISLFGFKHEIKINWEIYKFTGVAETIAGDIGLLVNVHLKSGNVIEGVAFIEAKKRKKDTIRFDALNKNQLKRLNRFSPFSRLLLYDYEDITQFPLNQSYLRSYKDFRYYNFRIENTFAVTIPINLVIANYSNNTNLYHLSLPFSYQLIYRYFHGLDLDYSRNAIDLFNTFPKSQGLPRYLMKISVGIGTDILETESTMLHDFYTSLE